MSDTDPYAAPNVETANKATEAANAEAAKAAPAAPQPEQKLPAAEPTVETVQVPEGSVKEVLRWVGDDADKAKAAIDAEKKGDNRSTLISKLEAIID